MDDRSLSTLNCFFLFLYLDSRVYSKKHVKKERSRERAELAKAWNLLDPLGKGEFHDYSTFKCTSGRSWSVKCFEIKWQQRTSFIL